MSVVDEVKKKKKKAVAFDNGKQDETAAAAPVNGDDEEVEDLTAAFSNLKKKKKKQQPAPSNKDDEEEEGEDEAAGDIANDDDDLDFTGGLKKKKKKKAATLTKASDEAAEAFEQELEEAGLVEPVQDDDDVFDEDDARSDDVEHDDMDSGNHQPWIKLDDKDYTYDDLLSRVFSIIRAANPDVDAKGGLKRIPPPQAFREGNKKTVFANLNEICKRLKRNPEHVVQFMFAELGTSGSVDGSARLIIKGRFQGKQLENVLRRYIMEYVTCKTCKSPDTILSKENRIYFMDCEKCGSRRSVSAIKTGYRANFTKTESARSGLV